MNGIQVLLIGGVIVIFLYYVFRLRNAVIDLLTLFVFGSIAVFFILFPGYTNTIAAKLGVGRGADLLFYLCILLFNFIILKLFARIRRLEKLLTEHIRQTASTQAQFLDTKPDDPQN
ncbi:MAG: DUF2304 domain-containing protein [Chitinophagaceae bacterium]